MKIDSILSILRLNSINDIDENELENLTLLFTELLHNLTEEEKNIIVKEFNIYEFSTLELRNYFDINLKGEMLFKSLIGLKNLLDLYNNGIWKHTKLQSNIFNEYKFILQTLKLQ